MAGCSGGWSHVCGAGCFRLDDKDAFLEGQRFCRGCTVPSRRQGALVANPTAAGVANDPLPSQGNVFSGDTRPGKDSGLEGARNQGHKDFVGEARNVIADGMKRFTSTKIAPPQPDWVRLADNVVSVLGQNPGAGQLNGTNCYIVGTGKKRVLIDAGQAGYADKFIPVFQRVMEEIGCESLQEILVTHLHHDHFGCIPELQELYGPDIPVGKLPTPESNFMTMDSLRKHDLIKFLEDENGNPRYRITWNSDGTASGVPKEEDLDWGDANMEWDRLGRTKSQIATHYGYLKQIYQFAKIELGNTYPYHELADDDVIVTEGATLRVVPTPGHAADHAAFHLKEGNSLFSGDHVLGFGTTYVQDMFDYMVSLKTMEGLKPTTLFPGHGPCIDDGTDYLQRYIKHRRDRVAQVYSTLLKNGGTRAVMTAREIADQLYTKTPPSRKQQAVQNVQQNLVAIVKAKRAHAYEYNEIGALQRHDVEQTPFMFNSASEALVWGLSKKHAKL